MSSIRAFFLFLLFLSSVVGCEDFSYTTGGNGYVADPVAPFCDQVVWSDPTMFGGTIPQPSAVTPCGNYNTNGHPYAACTYAPANYYCGQCDFINECNCVPAPPAVIPSDGCQLSVNPAVICLPYCS